MAHITRVKVEYEDEKSPEIHEIPDDDDINELEHLRKLFIGGLAPYTTEEGLKTFYGQWGKVVDVVVMRDSNTKRSRGFGFITYTKSAMVDKAQENRPHVIDGKTVEAKRALPRPERESRETNISVKKLFVGGLKDNHDEECLHEYFSQFGNVVSVKLLTDKTTGKRRGFAFIEFDDYDAVDKAILQKTHSIKYVLVDVKKSIYNLEKKDKGQQNSNAPPSNNLHQTKQASNGPGQQQQQPPYRPQAPPQQGPYQPPPPVMNAPPPNYNYWGPPPPVQQHYYQQPPPQQMNAWNGYSPAQNGWNGPPPPPPGAPHWHNNNQWGCPPPVGPPQIAQGGPPTRPMPAPPVAGNWNVPPVASQPIAGQSGGPINAALQPPLQQQQPLPQQQPQPNFGTGYQQNYGGGPTKHNMNTNRMNPYNAPPNNNYVNGQPPATGYGGYNTGPPNGGQVPQGSAPKPMTNGTVSASGTAGKYRR